MSKHKNDDDEPLQLIEFVQNRERESKEIKLNNETLDIVLEKCGKRQISIFCVCGPSRKGKSFLLGYMIRCLEALEKQEMDWMDWSNPMKPLSGFKFRNGVRPETQGIWVWSRPFIVTNGDGKEVCVLLIDTQGTQDEFTSTRDMSAIVGLSLLTSSVMIFNFFTDLQEDILVALNTYIQYGLLAHDNSEDDEPPFQKLTFLIRDWNMPTDFSYGSRGGRRFLEEKLKIKPDQPEEAKALRQNLKNCFQHLDCFLLPHIGAKALHGSFKGSISELDDKFAKMLEQFIDSIISTDDILVKEIMGAPISSEELRSYMEMFVDTFNSEDIPSPSNMLEATTKVHNDNLVRISLAKYKDKITRKLKYKNFLSEQDLQEAHRSGEKAALSHFKKAKKFGDSKTLNAYKVALVQQISENFRETTKQNEETRRRIIAEATNNAVSTFRDDLCDSFKFHSDTDFFEDAELLQIAKQLQSKALDEFKAILLEETPDVLQDQVDRVSLQMTEITNSMVTRNNAQRSNAKGRISEVLKELTASYKVKMLLHLEEIKFGELDNLSKYHENVRDEVVKRYTETEKPGNNDFWKEFEKQLCDEIKELYLEIHDQFKRSQKDVLEQALVTIGDECKGLLSQLRSFSETSACRGPDDLQTHCQQLEDDITKRMITIFPFSGGSDYYIKLVGVINEKAEIACEKAIHELKAAVQKMEESNNKVIQECIQLYQQEMQDFCDESSGFKDEQELKDAHDRIMQKIMDMYQNASATGFLTKRQDILNRGLPLLNEGLEKAFNEIKKNNENNLTKAKLETSNLQTECVSMYDQSMKEKLMEGVMSKEELAAYHEASKSKVLTFFENQSPMKLVSYSETLEQKLEKAYELHIRELETVLTKCEGSRTEAIQKCMERYQQQMEDFLDGNIYDNDELQKVHEKLKEESLALLRLNLQTSQKLEITIEELVSEIEDMFDVVKRINSDNLDSATLKAANAKNNCFAEYVKVMKKASEAAKTEDELRNFHEAAKEKVLETFDQQVNIQISKIKTEFLDSLLGDIEESYMECLELFELMDETVSKGLLIDCRQHYHAEMGNQFGSNLFVQPKELLELHKKAMTVVLKKLMETSNNGLTSTQQSAVLEEMDNQFEIFKMKNDMKLNYETGEAPAIGIDLGTTYCCVGVFYQGKVIIIPNQDHAGNLTTPSYVAFHKGTDNVVVGEAAKETAYKNLDNTVYDAKRIIGRTMDDPLLQNDIKMWPFTVKEDEGVPKIFVNEKALHPEQVSAKLLSYLKYMTEKYLKLERGAIKKAVITVPAYFTDGQRQATVDAGRLAGLEVLTILNEPTAAAVAYSLERLEQTAKKVLVYDLGGGTFDVAVLDMKPKEIDVLGVDGDTHLGGEDFDKNIMTFCAEKFKEMQGIDLFKGKDSEKKSERNDAKRRLRRVQMYCENVKKQLATATFAKISIDAIAMGLDLEVDITREEFEQLNDKEFRKTIEIVERVLKTVGVKKEEIDDIVLVGGSSRILKVQEMLKAFFGGKALNHTIHPDHCVAYGAAVKAAIMNGEQSRGHFDFNVIQDVTAYSMGVENYDKTFSIIVPRNTKIPCLLNQRRITVENDQTAMHFFIYQGEKRIAKENAFLGDFLLEGIPKGKPGQFPALVTMEINAMGIIHVTAVCEESGTTSSIVIKENKQRMSEETIVLLLLESED